MYSKMKKIISYFKLIYSLPLLILYSVSKQKNIINKDIEKWVEVQKIEYLKYSKFMYLHQLMLDTPAFRNVFYFRCKHYHVLNRINKILYPPLKSLEIVNNQIIGGGLYLQHGFSTIVIAKSIGENCWINQQVTIGWVENKGCPTIGNNVHIYAGAVVVGDIYIGDNVIIGANATVVKDIPANCTVVGNPSYIIKRDGIKVYEKL